MTFDVLAQQLINGLVLGSFYALVALGYTMIYGIIRLWNLAHGDLFMLGGFAGFYVFSALSSSGLGESWLLLPIMMLTALVAVGLLSVVIDRIAYRPLRNAPPLAPLLSALGVSIFLQNGALLAFGARPKTMASPFPGFQIPLGGAVLNGSHVVIVVSALLLMLGLHLFVTYTTMGKAMRATAQDREMAMLMGINIDHVIAVTFFIGAGLGAASGVMVGAYYGVINYSMGFLNGLRAFTSAILGGIGSIPGAMLGGMLIGLLESFSTALLPSGSAWKDVIVFAVLIGFLILRPQGIFGTRTRI
jgi:branched-chain amino acid transport system permease protein